MGLKNYKKPLIAVVLLASILCTHFYKSNKTNGEYIKWMEFNATSTALGDALKADISTNADDYPVSFIDIIAYLATKYGNNFKKYSKNDINTFMEHIKNGEAVEDFCNMKYFDYYKKSYGAVLDGFVDDKKDGTYGLVAHFPVALGYGWSHYKDFGASRSYGFKRTHLGNDVLGSIGTPIIAVEDGYVEALGWNRYGGWRIGIRSNDKKRYYYYAHLRKDRPYVKNLKEGDMVKSGQVIGYLGMTGYSIKENVNNINIPHLHFGMQIIFDESQKDGAGEIWIDVYELLEFLSQNKAKVIKNESTGDYEYYEN